MIDSSFDPILLLFFEIDSGLSIVLSQSLTTDDFFFKIEGVFIEFYLF